MALVLEDKISLLWQDIAIHSYFSDWVRAIQRLALVADLTLMGSVLVSFS